MRCQAVFNQLRTIPIWERWDRDRYLFVEELEDDFVFMTIRPERMAERGEREVMRLALESGPAALSELYLGMKVYAGGIKAFTCEDMEALENIEIRFGLGDYSQPFETFVIEFPEGYSKNRIVKDTTLLDGRLGDVEPAFAVLWKHPTLAVFIGGIYNTNGQCCAMNFYGRDMSIEELLDGYEHSHNANMTPEEVANTKRSMRACMNAASMLMEFGMKSLGPANPSHHARCIRRGNVGEAKMVPMVYGFAQKVKLYTRTSSDRTDETGNRVRTHWRRGYRRRQHHGPGNSLVKIVTIPAVLVNADLFGGSVGNTSVEYR